jgi:integrase
MGIYIIRRNILNGEFPLAHFDKDRLLKLFNEHDVSENNQEVVIEYLQDIQRVGKSNSTLVNNMDFMKWLVQNTKTDLDKLTRRDIKDIQDKINNLKRKKDGKPAAATTKQLYKISLKRFLKKYGKEIENHDMVRLADFEMAHVKPPRLKPEDLLTDEEIEKILTACTTLRDRTLIAVMIESGARVGEIEHCTLRDVTEQAYGFNIILRGKTGERTFLLYKCQQILKWWLSVHPDYDNMDSPLFPTTRRYNENSFTVKELRTPDKDTPRKFRPLNSKQIGAILKEAAAAAGIEKNVHPHLLRHTAATNFASHFTEQQMKQLLGWTPSSPMCGTYTHLADTDLHDALLQSYGVKVERDKEGNKVKKCPKCDRPITVGLKRCECGMPLTDEEAQFTTMLADAVIKSLEQQPGGTKSLLHSVLGIDMFKKKSDEV